LLAATSGERCGSRIVSRLKIAIAGFATFGVLLALPAGGPAAQNHCSARASTTLLENSQVRVYKQPTRYGARGFDVFSCLKATGEGDILGGSSVGDYPFLPPAIDLAGPVIGYATEECDREFCGTSIDAVDVRHKNSVDGFLNSSYGSPRHHTVVKVGSLRVSRRGTLVWIACPERSKHSKLIGSRKPNCVRAGDADAVYLRAPGGKPLRRLDHGRTIDPSSLRLKAGRASWVHGRHRRSAPVT
jgi:hypothetical protein